MFYPRVEAADAVRVHVGPDGLVWYGRDDATPFASNMPAGEFVASNVWRSAKAVQVVGLPANAPLLIAFQEARARKDRDALKQAVLVGNPWALGVTRSTPPADVLYGALVPPRRHAATGVWHPLTLKSFCTFAMIAEVSARGCGDKTRRIMKHHAAWPALSFVPSLDADAACRLVCDVVDPRWYRHPHRRNRLSKLYARLGLTPDNVAAALDVPGARPGRRYEEAANVVECWLKRAATPELDDPRAFLWRVAAGHDFKVRGFLAACKRLVAMAAAAWEADLSAHPELAFSPQQFFKNPHECAAYSDHISALNCI